MSESRIEFFVKRCPDFSFVMVDIQDSLLATFTLANDKAWQEKLKFTEAICRSLEVFVGHDRAIAALEDLNAKMKEPAP